MPKAVVFEVSDNSFQKYVIGNSNTAPVFVAFITVWSEPCIQMSGMLAELAAEFPEQFILAKVDIDENPALKEQYGIANVPTLKVIIDGNVAVTEEGALSEDGARELLKRFDIVNPLEEMRMQARQHHLRGETPQAIMLLTQAMQEDPSNIRVAMDMVQVLIDIGEIAYANDLFNKLPETEQNSATGISLKGQLWIIEQAARTPGLEVLNEMLHLDPDNYDARFDCAICEIAEHNYQQALEHLFYIQQHKAAYKDGVVREMIVTVINTIAPSNPEMAQKYRAQLGAILDV